MKRFVAVSAVLILIAGLAAQAICAETGEKRINLSFKNEPFPEAVRRIFAGSKTGYWVDPALSNLRISARLNNVTRDQAISVIAKTAGIVCAVEGHLQVQPEGAGDESVREKSGLS